MTRRLEPGWNFSTLYLIKDSLAIMLEAAGLLEDAFREYFELEACYLEALKQGGNLAGRHFGRYLCMHAHLGFLHARPCVCSTCCGLCVQASVCMALGGFCMICTASHRLCIGEILALFAHTAHWYTAKKLATVYTIAKSKEKACRQATGSAPCSPGTAISTIERFIDPAWLA